MKAALIIISIVEFLLSCYVLGVAIFHIVKLKNRIIDLETEVEKLKNQNDG